MASTSSNKMPLLVDSVLHNVVSLNAATNNGLDVVGSNFAVLLVNGIGTDGAIIEDIYSIARSSTPATINLYMSSAFDYLRPSPEGEFIGQFTSGTTVGAVTRWGEMPKVLSPVPRAVTGSDSNAGEPVQLGALYIPRGKTLWAARESADALSDGPLIGVSGGFY